MALSEVSPEQRLLPRLARAVTASLGLGDVLAEASRAAADLAPETFALIWLVQDDRLVLRAAAGVLETAQSSVPTTLAIREGLAGAVARTRQALIVTDPAGDPRTHQAEFLLAERVRWFVGFPLDGRYRLQGVLGVFGRSEPLEDESLEALGGLATQVALTVETAQLDADRERRRRHTEALAAVGQALAHSLDPGEVAQLIADTIITVLDARDVVVFRLEPDTGDLVSVAFASAHAEGPVLVLPPGVGLAGRAALERRALTAREVRTDPGLTFTPELRARMDRLDLHAGMAAPLLVDGRTIGVLALAAGPGVVFGDEARSLLEAFADQASVALNTTRLFAAERSARAEAETAGRRFRGLVESIDAVVTEFQLPERRVLFVSRRAESLLGYPIAQWTDEPGFWQARLHPEDRRRVLDYARAETAA